VINEASPSTQMLDGTTQEQMSLRRLNLPGPIDDSGTILMSDPFQFITLEQLRTFDSPIVSVITADMVQDFAEHDCGGQLTDDELQLFHAAGFGRIFPNYLAWIEDVIDATRTLAKQVKKRQGKPKSRATNDANRADVIKGPWEEEAKDEDLAKPLNS
jgi:hypothetical protein